MTSFNFIKTPSDRTLKNREHGLSSLIDKGMTFVELEHLLMMAGQYVDIVKLGFGTARLYPEDLLKKKINLLKANNIYVCPGGTFFEIAFSQQVVPEFFKECQRVGFNSIEISDGVIEMSLDEKTKLIKEAKKLGFIVFSEVGRKDEQKDLSLTLGQRIKEIHQLLEAGAWKVILESREAGNLGIYSKDTSVKEDEFKQLIDAANPKDLIFEAPHKHQQVWLIKQLGNSVNLANLAPSDIISVESLRQSLRADTI